MYFSFFKITHFSLSKYTSAPIRVIEATDTIFFVKFGTLCNLKELGGQL